MTAADLPLDFSNLDVSRAVWQDAVTRMNAIGMTIGQLECGMAKYRSSPLGAMERLVAFCESEGLHPPVTAAHAMRMRWSLIDEMIEGDVDLKTEDPATYASLVTVPVDHWFDYGTKDEYPDDDDEQLVEPMVLDDEAQKRLF